MKMNYCYQMKKKYENIYNKRLDAIEELSKKNYYNNLKFMAESSGNETDFTKKENPIVFLTNFRANKIIIERAKN